MTTPPFETKLRSALAEYAAGVPEARTARLRDLDYQPRLRSRASTVGLAGASLAAAGAVAAAAASAASGGAVPMSTAATGHTASGHTMKLASFTFTLPARARVTSAVAAGSCGPQTAPRHAETVVQAGGVFRIVNGGCLHADLGPAAVPPGAQHVAVGTYNGFITHDAAAARLTLYVQTSTRTDLVFTATGTGLSAGQLITMAAAGLPPCSAGLADAPPCRH
jgi:hypothetical protein